jgi:hypothetical protein
MSNVADRAEGYAVLLPVDPDASARSIRAGLRELTGASVAVIVSDSFGSPVREDAIGAAIGIAGIRHAEEPERDADLFGNASKPMMNRVDEIASAASILMGQTAAARPVVVGRGVPYTVDENASIAQLLTPPPVPDADGTLLEELAAVQLDHVESRPCPDLKCQPSLLRIPGRPCDRDQFAVQLRPLASDRHDAVTGRADPPAGVAIPAAGENSPPNWAPAETLRRPPRPARAQGENALPNWAPAESATSAHSLGPPSASLRGSPSLPRVCALGKSPTRCACGPLVS